MVRIKDGNYIAIFYDRMIEVKADSKRDAYNKAKRYFESREDVYKRQQLYWFNRNNRI